MKSLAVLGFGIAMIAFSSAATANSCTYTMGVECPPNLGPQSFVNGLEVQLNGGVGPTCPELPPVGRIEWWWGDGTFDIQWFPAYHEYSDGGEYTIVLKAFDVPQDGSQIAETLCTLTVQPLVPVMSCLGFYSPMASFPVKAKKNRVFPLKFELFDGDGFEIGDSDVTASPVVEVMFTPSAGGGLIDSSDDVLAAGQGTDGNEFVYTEDGIWQFNLKSKNYTAHGEYVVTAVSGDDAEYTIDPACVTSFFIQ